MKTRVRIFVDFWNFQLGWNDYHERNGKTDRIRIPWDNTLPTVLVGETCKSEPGKFAGAHVYASVDPSNPNDRPLRGFLQHVLKGFPGYSVTIKERRPRKKIRCRNCKAEIAECQNCRAPLSGTVEKGVDAAVITDLIASAFDDTYDQAILISGDADYAPAVEYIQKKTDKQVIQAFFKAHGNVLRNACWDHIFFDDFMSKLIPPDNL